MTNPDAPETTAKSASPTLIAEQALCDRLTLAFAFLTGCVVVPRTRRLWVQVPLTELHAVLVYAKVELGFDMLCTITGTDEGENLGYLYHLAHDNGIVLSLTTMAPKDGLGPSTVTPYFPLAELYERELIDLLGARIQGLPVGNRYPLPDGWPEGQYPLRKSWKPEGATSAKEQQGD